MINSLRPLIDKFTDWSEGLSGLEPKSNYDRVGPPLARLAVPASTQYAPMVDGQPRYLGTLSDYSTTDNAV